MGAYKLLINGEMVDGDLSMDVLNPATEEKLCRLPSLPKTNLTRRLQRPRQLFPHGQRPMWKNARPSFLKLLM